MALDYAHGQGVIRRDIKPDNIMPLEDGRVNVTDFGIAPVVDSSKTHTGAVLGTPNYMPAEQVVDQTLDGRSDLFSLGIVFYELLAGAKPFKGDTISAIIHAITHNAHPPLSGAQQEIPVCCQAIVDRLLLKGQNEFPQVLGGLQRRYEILIAIGGKNRPGTSGHQCLKQLQPSSM